LTLLPPSWGYCEDKTRDKEEVVSRETWKEGGAYRLREDKVTGHQEGYG
jgi:hypothetical protein